jgi:hypothetical protein
LSLSSCDTHSIEWINNTTIQFTVTIFIKTCWSTSKTNIHNYISIFFFFLIVQYTKLNVSMFISRFIWRKKNGNVNNKLSKHIDKYEFDVTWNSFYLKSQYRLISRKHKNAHEGHYYYHSNKHQLLIAVVILLLLE